MEAPGLDQLKQYLHQNLEERGVMNKLRGLVRAEIFHWLEGDEAPKNKLSNENLLINEIIREYLEYNGYQHTKSVFLTESGQPAEPLGRGFVAGELNIVEDSQTRKRPLLYSLIQIKHSYREHSDTNRSAKLTGKSKNSKFLNDDDGNYLEENYQTNFVQISNK